MPSNVLPLHLKQTFPLIIWIFSEDDEIKSRLPFKIFSTLPRKNVNTLTSYLLDLFVLTSIYVDVNQPQRCPFTVCFANKMTLIAEILGAKVHLLSGGLNWRKSKTPVVKEDVGGCFLASCLSHCGFKCLKPATNKFTWCAFTNFSINEIHKTSVSSHSMRFTLKFVKSLQVVNITKFSNLIFGGSLLKPATKMFTWCAFTNFFIRSFI